ncbi:MAG TPA: DUF3488 and transglutaminase-like domain-containing protein [Nocardioides sp.]
MSRPRLSLRHGVAFAVVGGMTTWVTMLPWGGFAEDSGPYLGVLLMLGLTLGATGAALRWLRVPLFLVPVAQALVVCVVLLGKYGGPDSGAPFPTPKAIQDTLHAFSQALASADRYAAPIPLNVPTVAPLIILSGAIALILVDLLAGALGRVPLSGLVLLMLYSLPVTVWDSHISWWIFCMSAGGFMFMLFLREDERFSQWGRAITGEAEDPTGFGVRTGTARTNAFAMGAAATAAALALPILVPTLHFEVFDRGNGPGGGNDVTIVNPMADLRRDLRQGKDVPVLTLRTDQNNPSYLRYSVLTNFDGNQWTTGNRTIPDSQMADGHDLPLPEGLSNAVPRTSFTADYQTTNDFHSEWLPVPTPATNVKAPNIWKYDLTTLDFISADDKDATNLHYTASGLDLDIEAETLAAAGRAPALILGEYATTDGIPDSVRSLAFDIIDGQTTDYGRAVTLQDWFWKSPEDGGGGFTYSTAVAPGNGGDDIEAFLTDGPGGRTGYCEQFASAMAIMARAVGIPARVAVGLLAPDQVGPDTYVFSTHDLHAWPELYFDGVGWVRFEPTPGGRNSVNSHRPAYTQGDISNITPSSLPTANPSSGDTAPKGNSPSARPSSLDSQGAGKDAGSFPWLTVLLVLVGVAILVALMLVPRTVRRVRRESRWHAGTAESAWAELLDAATDLGVVWPPGRSPQATAAILAEHFAAAGDLARPVHGPGTNPDADQALARLVHAVEVERYAPRPLEVSAEALRADVLACVEAMRCGVPERTRRRADWLPSSLRSRRAQVRAQTSEVEAGSDQVVEHVGR